MNNSGDDGVGLWDEEDGFFYDVLHLPDGTRHPLKVRSMVGLIPLFAVETLEPELLDAAARLQAAARVVRREPAGPHRATSRACRRRGAGERRLLSVVDRRSAAPRAARACSTSASSCRRTASARCRACHQRRAVRAARRRPRASRRLRAGRVDDRALRRQLELARAGLVPGQLPADRGAAEVPPLLRRRASRVECPTGSGSMLTLGEVADRALAAAVADLPARRGRPAAGVRRRRRASSAIRTGATYVPFHEYFHGDNGARRRRQPPDRLDRPRRQAAAAERRRRGRPGDDPGGGRRTWQDADVNGLPRARHLARRRGIRLTGRGEAPVTCRDFADFLLDYVEGELPGETRRRFDEHMAICSDCVQYLQHYTETIKAGRLALADDLPADVPDELVSAILRARDGIGISRSARGGVHRERFRPHPRGVLQGDRRRRARHPVARHRLHAGRPGDLDPSGDPAGDVRAGAVRRGGQHRGAARGLRSARRPGTLAAARQPGHVPGALPLAGRSRRRRLARRRELRLRRSRLSRMARRTSARVDVRC